MAPALRQDAIRYLKEQIRAKLPLLKDEEDNNSIARKNNSHIPRLLCGQHHS